MNHRIVCIGRNAKDPLVESALDYEKRLHRYAPVEVIRRNGGDAKDEAKILLAGCAGADRVVALDEHGKTWRTLDLANKLQQWAGHKRIAWLIGGADGLDPSVLEKSHERLSLSAFTLPHRLALVVLLEQLYRAHTLLRGEAYHRE